MNKIGYAYIGGQGLLHIVDDEITAKESAKYNGKVVKTDFPHAAGDPVIDIERDDRIHVDVMDKTVKAAGKMISWEDFKQKYPAIYQIVQQLQ